MAGKALLSAAGSVYSIHRSLLTIAVLTLPSFRFLRSSPEVLSPKIDEADVFRTLSSSDVSYSTIYHSSEVFFKGYAAMEEKFNVFIYPDGDPNTYFQTPRKLTGKYSSEGYFFQNIRESRFRTEDPDKANLFFVPVSCHKMRGKVQKHFEWHSPPIPYDAFHMVMYELWLRHDTMWLSTETRPGSWIMNSRLWV